MEMSEIGKRLAEAVDKIDNALDTFADNMEKRLLPQVKAAMEKLSKIDWNDIR